ncbi:hypothetical protein C8R44DRAFT_753968 [Mycena epipterygia]|nr:hypothetical protein C8R44DRAFT_753968 [Mycena epipterygia]
MDRGCRGVYTSRWTLWGFGISQMETLEARRFGSGPHWLAQMSVRVSWRTRKDFHVPAIRSYHNGVGADWLSLYLKTPECLKNAFPDREPEEEPSTVYWSAAGNRTLRHTSERSSWRARNDISLPLEDFEALRKDKDFYDESASNRKKGKKTNDHKRE